MLLIAFLKRQWLTRNLIATKLTQSLGLVVVLGAAVAAPVAGLQKPDTQTATAPGIPDALIASVASEDRERWLHAANELGRLASADQQSLRTVWNRTRVNTIGMVFKEIAAGEFIMGPSAEPDSAVAMWRPDAAKNCNRVRISRRFFLAATELTNDQYSLLIEGHTPSRFSAAGDSPVAGISWDHASDFCRKLSEREGVVYRLPTEAEWEYACRAGSQTRFSHGDDPLFLSDYAWFGQFVENAQAVARLKPNRWGLYDMHGNVSEWVLDWYAPYGVSNAHRENVAVEVDPRGPQTGTTRVLRGGMWACWEPSALASAKRATPSASPLLLRLVSPQFPSNGDTTGFRVVREAAEPP